MYKSLEEIAQVSKQKNIPFWQVILEDDCKERMVSPEQSKKELMAMYQAMKEADAAYDAKQKSRSGMVGGNGQLFHDAVVSGKTICGPVIASAIEKALKMGESNACMKRIVAAPTAGACGVVPAVYLTLQEQRQSVCLRQCILHQVWAVSLQTVHFLRVRQEVVRQRLVLQVQWQQQELFTLQEETPRQSSMQQLWQ